MSETPREDYMRRQMKMVDKFVEELDTEVISYAVDKMGAEIERRSQKEIEYLNNRRRKINV